MRKYILILIALCGLLLSAGSAWSYSVGLVDVGDVDTFKAKTLLTNSGDLNEVNWVNSVLGTSFTAANLAKYNTNEGAGWSATDQSGIYAYSFGTSKPEYFYIKVGVGNNDPQFSHFLYKNIENLNWAVANLTVDGVIIKNIGKFSHIGILSQVPEPASMILLGIGLLGLAGIGRKLTDR